MVHAAAGKHSDWLTPKVYIEAARQAMGTIDLDPASSALANMTVKAGEFYTSRGLQKEWHGNVFLNPPYSNYRGEAADWVEAARRKEWEGEIKRAVVLVNQSILYQVTDALKYATICIVDHRIAFIDGRTMKPQKSPPQSNVFIYFGEYGAGEFEDAFEKFGAILDRRRAGQ